MSQSSRGGRPSLVRIWWTAARPHTLLASLNPCVVAIACNYYKHVVSTNKIYVFVLWTIFCGTIQLGTNLHNDYSDYVRGADTSERIGQARATAQGWLTPKQTCVAATTVLSITFYCGYSIIQLVTEQANVIADDYYQYHVATLWCLVLTSLFNAFAYTGGPYPLGYIGMPNFSLAYTGLGDLFVFLYFGLVATWMIPYVLYLMDNDDTTTTTSIAFWPHQFLYGLQVGLLATNILVVNNLRDRLTDVKAHKRTTAVRFGRNFSIRQYQFHVIAAYALVLVNVIYTVKQSFDNRILILLCQSLPLLSWPMANQQAMAVLQTEGAALNKHVGGAAKVQTLFCLLLAIGNGILIQQELLQ